MLALHLHYKRSSLLFTLMFVIIGALEGFYIVQLGVISSDLIQGYQVDQFQYNRLVIYTSIICVLNILMALLSSSVIAFYTSRLPLYALKNIEFRLLINTSEHGAILKNLYHETEKVSQWYIVPVMQIICRISFIISVTINLIGNIHIELEPFFFYLSLLMLFALYYSMKASKRAGVKLASVQDSRMKFLHSSMKLEPIYRALKFTHDEVKPLEKDFISENYQAYRDSNFWPQIPRLIIELSILLGFVGWAVLHDFSSLEKLLVLAPALFRLLPHIQKIFSLLAQISAGLESLARISNEPT